MIVIRDADPVTVKEVVMNKFRPQDKLLPGFVLKTLMEFHPGMTSYSR